MHWSPCFFESVLSHWSLGNPQRLRRRRAVETTFGAVPIGKSRECLEVPAVNLLPSSGVDRGGSREISFRTATEIKKPTLLARTPMSTAFACENECQTEMIAATVRSIGQCAFGRRNPALSRIECHRLPQARAAPLNTPSAIWCPLLP